MTSLKHMRKKTLVIDFCIGIFCLLLLTYILHAVINSKNFQFFGTIVPSVETSKKVVALTFDDSPEPGATEELLKALEKTNTKATFFLIGKQVELHPSQTKKIISAGHELGNHSYTHYSMTFLSPSLVKSEIEKTDKVFADMGYEQQTHFRPPYGNKLLILPHYLASTNRKTIMWNIAPDDHPSIAKNHEFITEYVAENVRPGSIIVMHPLYEHRRESLKAVEPIINRLTDMGYEFVTVSELLTYQGK